jgi:biopolymer transport protein TolQ
MGEALAWDTVPPVSTDSPARALIHIAFRERQRISEAIRTYRASLSASVSFFLENQFHIADERMDSGIVGQSKRLERGLTGLAIVSTVAPLLGLLGTVWGITHSFFQIGEQKSATLAVVAPGIAEALITTIAGLIVAIPSVAFYNYLTHAITNAQDAMEDVKAAMTRLLRLSILNGDTGGDFDIDIREGIDAGGVRDNTRTRRT